MSDLQLSLLALGAVIIAAVILFNWWQERRFMHEGQNRFEEPSGDILMEEDFQIDPERIAGFEPEPVAAEESLHDTRIPEDALLEELHAGQPAFERAAPVERQEPFSTPFVIEDPQVPAQPDYTRDLPETPEPEVEAPAAPAVAPPETRAVEPEKQPEPTPVREPALGTLPNAVDEQIDLIGKAALPSVLDVAAFIDALQQMPRFDKPVQWLLQDESGIWRALSADLPSGRYPQFIAALQLADRSGPVSQGTLMAFQEQVQNLADSLGAHLEWNGAADPLQYAIELDQFCIGVDVMVGFHILQGGNGPFAGTKLRGLAESAGMKLHEDGAFHHEDAQGHTLYTLVSQDQRPFKPETLRTVFYRGVSFQLDVPKVESTSEAFNRMVLFARQLETALDGALVDDNQRALGDVEVEKIRQQLKMIHAKMVARSILPGTPSALRLFS